MHRVLKHRISYFVLKLESCSKSCSIVQSISFCQGSFLWVWISSFQRKLFTQKQTVMGRLWRHKDKISREENTLTPSRLQPPRHTQHTYICSKLFAHCARLLLGTAVCWRQSLQSKALSAATGIKLAGKHIQHVDGQQNKWNSVCCSFLTFIFSTPCCDPNMWRQGGPVALGRPSYLFNSLADPSIRATALLAKLALSLIIPSLFYSSNADHYYSQSFAFVDLNFPKKVICVKRGNDEA